MLLIVALAFLGPGTLQSEERPPDVVLDRFVGRWTTEAVITNFGQRVREVRTRGHAIGRRGLDGGRVEFRTSSVDPPGMEEVQVMTYDAEAGLYRQWVSDSDGYRHEARGRWDPATSTLTWEGQAEGTVFVIADSWVSPHRLEWTLTRTSANGELRQTIRGVVSRSAP